MFLLLGLIVIYRRFRARTEPTPPGIPKPKSKNQENKEEEKPRTWKKLSGVKTASDSSEVSKVKKHDKSPPPKSEPLKETVSTNTNQRVEKISSNIKNDSRKEPYKPKIENKSPKPTVSVVENNVKKTIQEEPKKVPLKRIVRPDRDEEKEALQFAEELKEAERKAEEEARKHLRPIHLNIDKNARSKDDLQKSSEREMDLVKKLCVEMREIAKTTNPEEREERQKEIEKVRSAR